MAKKIACQGDFSDHGGVIIDNAQDETLRIAYSGRAFGSGAFGSETFGGALPAMDQASHVCPIKNHGTTAITANTIKSKHNSKLILAEGATAGCGAVIAPVNRNVNVE